MNYSELFLHAWRRVWQSRLLWLLGVFTSLGASGAALLRLWLSSTIAGRLSDLETWLAKPDAFYLWLESQLAPAGAWFAGGLAAFFIVSLALWLVITVAEGGLIVSVLQLEEGQRTGWWQAVGAGRRWLARFIGIDTVLYFPLFLLNLMLMLLLSAALVGIALLSMQGAALQSTLRPLAVGAICLIPLFLLLLPSLVMTSLLRKLAFRYAVIRDTGVSDTIRQSWRLFRQQAGPLLLLFAMLWGISYLANLFLGLLTIPLFGLESMSGFLGPGSSQELTWSQAATSLFAAAVAVITLFSLALVHAYVATVWTLACRQFISRPGAESGTDRQIEVQTG